MGSTEDKISESSANNQDSSIFDLPSDVIEAIIGKLFPTQELSRLACSHPFFHNPLKEELIEREAAKLLQHVLSGEIDKAELMINRNPSLLLQRVGAIDASKRTILATAFQAALGAEDSLMWEMMKPYFELIPALIVQSTQKSLNITELARQEMLKQFEQQLPSDLDDEGLKKATGLVNLTGLYNKLAQRFASAIDDDAVDNIITEFRKTVNMNGQTIESGKHFNMLHLVAALKVYYSNYTNLATQSKRDTFWVKVIGFIQRQMPTNFVQAHCSGLKNVEINPANLKRSVRLHDGTNVFPLDDIEDKRLGFEFALLSLNGNLCNDNTSVNNKTSWAIWLVGDALEKCIEHNRRALKDLETDLKTEPQISDAFQPTGCIISTK